MNELNKKTDTAIDYSTCYRLPLFTRIWAMPNKLTFTIKPIKELVGTQMVLAKIEALKCLKFCLCHTGKQERYNSNGRT